MKLALRTDFAREATTLATRLVGPVRPFLAGRRLSAYAHWFESDDAERLVAVVTPGDSPKAADEALAYGLAWQGDRDLVLVLPGELVRQIEHRLPWIEAPVRVFARSAEGEARPVAAPSRQDVLERMRTLPFRARAPYVLGDAHLSWIEGVQRDDLEHHQRSCLSWHNRGLQVLRVERSRGGLRVRAGVQYKNHAERRPYDRHFTAPPTNADIEEINRYVRRAVDDGRSLTSQQREHQMQATLSNQARDLGLLGMVREFPSHRGLAPDGSGRGRPGFIDFLGWDRSGRLHVVETKIGRDVGVVLQALDYAIWTTAHNASIRKYLRATAHEIPSTPRGQRGDTVAPFHLVLGAAPRQRAFNEYLAPQLEALSGDVRYSVHLTADPLAQPLSLTVLPTRALWEPSDLVAAPVVGPRWSGRVAKVLGR